MKYDVLTTLRVREETFKIVKHNSGFYCAINEKYIGEDGYLTKALNGLEMNVAKTIQDCVQNTRRSVEVDYLKSQGMTLEQAIRTACAMY